jgi:Cu-Zn family superoxide dismutase
MVAQQGTLEPTFKKHGKWGVGEYHKGILVILQQMQMETEQLHFTDEWNIGSGDPTKEIF